MLSIEKGHDNKQIEVVGKPIWKPIRLFLQENQNDQNVQNMSERSDLMSQTSLEEVDYVGPEEHGEENNNSMKLIEAINSVKGLKLDRIEKWW